MKRPLSSATCDQNQESLRAHAWAHGLQNIWAKTRCCANAALSAAPSAHICATTTQTLSYCILSFHKNRNMYLWQRYQNEKSWALFTALPCFPVCPGTLQQGSLLCSSVSPWARSALSSSGLLQVLVHLKGKYSENLHWRTYIRIHSSNMLTPSSRGT